MTPGKDNYNKGPAWYRANFPVATQLNKQYRVFETSPLYLFNPLAPKRLASFIPDVKLVVILRNPTERAISQWLHEQRFGHESLPIMEALQEEENRLRHVINSGDYKNNAFIQYSYKSRGLYYEQLKRYRNYFPPENFFIVNSERFFPAPADTLRHIFRFLGVEEVAIDDLKARNVAGNRPKINPEVYQYLNNYFRAPNHELYDFVGENYGW